MKAVRLVLLFAIVLFGCGACPPPLAVNKTAAVKQRPPELIFPYIKPVFMTFHLQIIEAYCRQRNMHRLSQDRVRLFVQPMGIVEQTVEIDLAHRQLTVYPGTHDRVEAVRTRLSEEQTAQIKTLITSEEFKSIPAENDLFGMDGCAVLLETAPANIYSWKLHWQPTDEGLKKVIDNILLLTKKPRGE